MDEPTFRRAADHALESVRQELIPVAEEHGFEVDYNSGALSIEFEEPNPARFVLSPNAPVRQVWLSALAKSFKLEWSDEKQAFLWPETGESLSGLVARLVGQHLGTPIHLA